MIMPFGAILTTMLEYERTREKSEKREEDDEEEDES